MKLLIVSGLSGAGKTIALHSLEDMGTYCVDNLPVSLLPAFAEQAKQLANLHDYVAVGVDARTAALHDLPSLLQTLSDTDIPYSILFLEADDAVLIKRYSETRRKHPLTTKQLPLAEAIKYERQLLAPLSSRADIRINTSQMHVHQLRDMIRLRTDLQINQSISILFLSFGFKYGLPQEADFIFDVRCLPNPHWDPELRPLTGRDHAVVQFLASQPKVQQMLAHISEFLSVWIPQFEADNRSYLTVAVGCTGGQHRSVYITEQLAQLFNQKRDGVLLRHRELV
ncbi:RNase adapter RapZ [Beggiatoa leptomitoformis]|uniref:RNase adapter RapZ n=1 Tax=Beggiatoa leptomitoformis TaxID=288004 RepID=A0A2N9YI17_9GAMM|nr:RNase adapter RapZ [Beggiatoa leptomitoformis]ALG67651.1 RNase adapter RapZ [Beggiatoa leptomitoformis]AUI70113.1 RNase adapter RapZ [Beggiatoa leptomitoformis]